MPSSIINSDDGVISGTSGLKSTGGDDGVLVFQSKGTETAQINTDKQIVAAAGTASLPVLTTTGDLNTGIYFPAADNIGFATGGTIRGRWTTDGLCFGSDTAAANALDDYEEGTWTPSVGGNATYGAQQNGWYVKVGKLVTVACDMTIDTIGTGNTQLIGGLPFSANEGGVTNGGGAVSYFANLSSGVYSLSTQLSGTNIAFVSTTSSQTTVNNTPVTLTNNTRIITTISYLTSS